MFWFIQFSSLFPLVGITNESAGCIAVRRFDIATKYRLFEVMRTDFNRRLRSHYCVAFWSVSE